MELRFGIGKAGLGISENPAFETRRTVSKDESFVSAKAGSPVVKVNALSTPTGAQLRRLGSMARRFSVPDDFDRMAEDAIGRIFDGGA
jgi:hypothetical protein